MADISIQFYASPAELEAFVSKWMKEHAIRAIAVKYRPFSLVEIATDELGSALDNSDIRRLYFLICEPNLDAKSKADFELQNPSALVLDVGHLDASGLSESWLMCRTEDKDAMAIWRRIAKSLKESTHEGITATNRTNGVAEFYRAFRYTEGASKLESEGTQMLSLQRENGPVIRLGDTTAKSPS